ncbi:flagellar filament capping protein FliD [Paenibacillus sp. GCM10027628]|uniref:flagellar filament capping protein FliD n=1 Tax=Paenibacillus sp. GCM10027628 TaxID=3273413 RepID=UPI00363A43AF
MVSSTSSTSSTNYSRVTGLISGMDTDGMVKKLMDAERIPLDKIMGQKQKLQWKQDAIRQLNVDIQTFITGTKDMRLQSSFALFTSNSSDPTVVTSKGTGSGANQVAQFSNITQLASAGQSVGTQVVANADANLTAAGSFTVQALQTDGTYKSTTINYTTADTVNGILSKINSSGIGATAFYDKNSGQVVMSANATGKGTTDVALKLTDTTGNLLTGTLGLSSSDGKNAMFTVNGLTTFSQSNTFNFSGIQYTLNKVNAGTVSVSTTRDVDGIVNKIKDYLTQYNTMLDKINGKASETVYRSYQPLTDAQKAEMKDTDIQAWEAKAKSGVLNNDSILQQASYGFRNDAYSTVQGLPTGSANQLSSIGITTDAYQTQGHLIIQDETKLRAALTNNPDQVIQMFTNYSATDSTQNGVAWKLYNRANSTISQLAAVGGSGTSYYDNSIIGKNITDYNTQINDWNIKLKDKETAYYNKFSAMETALSRLQSQSSNLISQMGGG